MAGLDRMPLMSFGKRRIPPAAPQADAAPPVLDLVTPEARHIDLRDTMLRLMRETAAIANAVRNEQGIDLLLVEGVFDPSSRPISLKGIDEHFTVQNAEGRRQHPVFAYVAQTGVRRMDQSAQTHLYLLITRILELNTYCQTARQDGALTVALQSPSLPPLIDRILVGTAHFAAFFDNLALGKSSARIGLNEQLQLTLERYKAMATDVMLEPAKYDAYVPYAHWPYRGTETLRDDHPGQRVISGVYFPAELVAHVLDHESRLRPAVRSNRR
jgi:hypothetical protein